MNRANRRSPAIRALVAFLALPGVVAFAIPLLLAALDGAASRPSIPGIVALVTGFGILSWCAYAFHAIGHGTLAPWAPPSLLVTSGLYRYSRNPMYIGIVLLLAGWSILFRSPTLGCYAALMALAFHLRVVLGEEPRLARTHGPEWTAYERSVPRWFWPVRRSEALSR